MVLPSTEEVFLIDSPDGFAALLARDDLPEASAAWWTAMISACSSCLALGTASDDGPRPIEWARALVSVLDAAANSGSIRKAELLARKIQVQVSAFLAGNNDFGDANDICGKAFMELASLGESVQSIANEIREISRGPSGSRARMVDLAALKRTVRALASIRDSVSEEKTRSELNLWFEVFNLT